MKKKRLVEILFLTLIFLGPPICSQDLHDFHGRIYSSESNVGRAAFLNNQSLIGDISWNEMRYTDISFLYDISKDVLVLRKESAQEVFLIELPKEHIQSFQYDDKRFVNLSHTRWKEHPDKVQGFVEEIVAKSFCKVFVKHGLEISTFANSISASPSYQAFALINDIWFDLNIKKQFDQFCITASLEKKNLINGLPKIKTFNLENWYQLAEKIESQL